MNIHCEACRNCSFRIGVLTYKCDQERSGLSWVCTRPCVPVSVTTPEFQMRLASTLRVETITKGTRCNLNLFDAVKNAHQIRLRHLQFSAVSLQMRANPQLKMFLSLSHLRGQPTVVSNLCSIIYDTCLLIHKYSIVVAYGLDGVRKSKEHKGTQELLSPQFFCFLCVCIISNDKYLPPSSVVNHSKLLFNS